MSLWSWCLLIAILDGVICAGLASYVAEKKGYSSGAWLAYGFLFGILGLIAAAGLTSQELDTCIQKACPDCAEMIKAQASVCRYCHHNFSNEEVVEELVSALEVDDFQTRVYAIECLGELPDASVAIPHLVKALENASSDFEFHYAAIQDVAADALSQIEDVSVIDQLMPMFDKECDMRAKCKAVEVLGELGEAALPCLEKIAESKEPEVRQAAKKTLKAMRSEDHT